jgi:hypothetical protein
MGRLWRIVVATMLGLGAGTGAEPARAYETAPVLHGGVIEGRVDAGRAQPKVEHYYISKNTDICGFGARDVQLVRLRAGALLDAVVYLEAVAKGKPFPAAAKKVTINQKGCRFLPSLSVLANGGELEAVNSDPALHNIHAYALVDRTRHTVLNVSQPERGNIVAKRFRLKTAKSMTVKCDAHDFMHAVVFIARNPYYAMVDEDGRFRITNVPPGTYVIRAWHSVLGERQTTVTVPAGGRATAHFSY